MDLGFQVGYQNLSLVLLVIVSNVISVVENSQLVLICQEKELLECARVPSIEVIYCWLNCYEGLILTVSVEPSLQLRLIMRS